MKEDQHDNIYNHHGSTTRFSTNTNGESLSMYEGKTQLTPKQPTNPDKLADYIFFAILGLIAGVSFVIYAHALAGFLTS